jgi:hypothetical protein
MVYQELSCTVPSGAMGRQKWDGNYSSPQNNLMQDSEGNEKKKTRYPIPDTNKDK